MKTCLFFPVRAWLAPKKEHSPSAPEAGYHEIAAALTPCGFFCSLKFFSLMIDNTVAI